MPQTLKLSATAQIRSLPISDHASLRARAARGDVPTLLMVLTHFEHDEAFLESFAPYIGSIFDVPKEIPEPMLTQLRERLFRALTTARPGTDTSVSNALMRRMLSVDVGEPVADEFIPMLMEQMGFDAPEARSARPGRHQPDPDFRVLVIGAGLTGLLAAIKLREAGYSFTVIEKNPEIGGTWWENTYPGVAVDTPSHFYSYSFELNPDWCTTRRTAPSSSSTCCDVAEKYALRQHVVFDTRVLGCTWDEARQCWNVEIQDANGTAHRARQCRDERARPGEPLVVAEDPGTRRLQGREDAHRGLGPRGVAQGKRVALIDHWLPPIPASTSDINNKPANQCHPATARPGKSNHESGLAVDFMCNGAFINPTAHPATTQCFTWLQAHAGEYGFSNLWRTLALVNCWQIIITLRQKEI